VCVVPCMFFVFSKIAFFVFSNLRPRQFQARSSSLGICQLFGCLFVCSKVYCNFPAVGFAHLFKSPRWSPRSSGRVKMPNPYMERDQNFTLMNGRKTNSVLEHNRIILSNNRSNEGYISHFFVFLNWFWTCFLLFWTTYIMWYSHISRHQALGHIFFFLIEISELFFPNGLSLLWRRSPKYHLVVLPESSVREKDGGCTFYHNTMRA